MKKHYLAIDIGASSGRHIVATVFDGKITTSEVYRFKNGVKTSNEHLIWDIEYLFGEVKNGIKAAFSEYEKIESLAIDTWGVDYVLLNGNTPITPCFSYRDNRTESIIKEVHSLMGFEKLYWLTGIQFQSFNTIYQLFDDKKRGRLEHATDFLMIPEYLNFMLTGVKMHEYTNATTTGLVNAQTKNYDCDIIQALGLKGELFNLPLRKSGAFVGSLKEEIAKEVGGQTEVCLCASHDTASAVEGIPMTENSPYISSGTWSLLGVKTEKPLTDDLSRLANYSNEGGVGYVRYQKNIPGMWIINRLKEELCPEKSFTDITFEAKNCDCDFTVDVYDESFVAPKNMKAAFDDYLSRENKKIENESQYFRCAILSLANGYKKALDELKNNTGKDFTSIYIVGGGAKNTLLNQFTEEICNVKVNALAIEATSLGNIKSQIRR